MMEGAGAFGRVAAIGENTFREAVRMRLFLFLALSGIASLGVGLFFQEFNLGSSELRFIADFGFGAISLLGSVMAIVATVQLIYGEIEHRTIMPLLAKPLSRGEFLAGKLIGAWLTICSFVAILTVSLIAALWIRESQMAAFQGTSVGGAVNYGNVLLFAALQCLRLIILASFSAFFATYATSALFAIFMGFFLWMIGQMHSVIHEQIAQSSGFGWELILRFVTLLVPDLRLFDLGTEVIAGESIAFSSFLQLAAYASIYALLYGLLGSLALRKREL